MFSPQVATLESATPWRTTMWSCPGKTVAAYDSATPLTSWRDEPVCIWTHSHELLREAPGVMANQETSHQKQVGNSLRTAWDPGSVPWRRKWSRKQVLAAGEVALQATPTASGSPQDSVGPKEAARTVPCWVNNWGVRLTLLLTLP